MDLRNSTSQHTGLTGVGEARIESKQNKTKKQIKNGRDGSFQNTVGAMMQTPFLGLAESQSPMGWLGALDIVYSCDTLSKPQLISRRALPWQLLTTTKFVFDVPTKPPRS